MKIVKPDAILIGSENLSAYEKIELIGRTCYKSEDKITDGSAVKFCQAMKNNGHFAMLEHGIIHLKMYMNAFDELNNALALYKAADRTDYEAPTFLHMTKLCNDTAIVTGSFRAFYELMSAEPLVANAVGYALKQEYPEIFDFVVPLENNGAYVMNDTELKEYIIQSMPVHEINDILSVHLYHTIKFTCNRGVSHEFVRHRPASFAQESTRYCSYDKGKFGHEITVIKPCFHDECTPQYNIWLESCKQNEETYFKLLELGCTPQEARDNLPNSTKTDIVITANEDEWKHIIALRMTGTTGKPHPQMKEVMEIAYPLLVKASNGRLSVNA